MQSIISTSFLSQKRRSQAQSGSLAPPSLWTQQCAGRAPPSAINNIMDHLHLVTSIRNNKMVTQHSCSFIYPLLLVFCTCSLVKTQFGEDIFLLKIVDNQSFGVFGPMVGASKNLTPDLQCQRWRSATGWKQMHEVIRSSVQRWSVHESVSTQR